MPKRKYRAWELSTNNHVSRSTIQHWRRRGIQFNEFTGTTTMLSSTNQSRRGVLSAAENGKLEAALPLLSEDYDRVSYTEDAATSGSPDGDLSICSSASSSSDFEEDTKHCGFLESDDSSISSEEDSDDISTTVPPSRQAPVSTTPADTQQLEDKLFVGSRITQGESLFLIMSHALKYHSSKEATENLLKIIEAHLPEGTSYPSTKYLFFKQFNMQRDSLNVYLYCSSCSELLCKDSHDECLVESMTCSKCMTVNSRDKLFSAGNYFLSLDVEVQLRELLEKHEGLLRGRASPSYNVGDITESPAYRKLPLTDDDISFTWNTDGVPVFESSQYSIWPLLLQVNELPYRERVQHQVLAGLWFGLAKPHMNSFLKPFVDTMNILSTIGFTWVSKSGEEKKSKVFPGPCSVDSVARCQLLNMVQFNGCQGCPWCEQQGEVLQVGNGHCRVYPILQEPSAQRTDESFKSHAKKAHDTGQVSGGVKGLNILFFLSYFSLTAGFVVDYMHAVCLGFVRATACMWFNHKRPHKYNIGKKISEIDFRLESLSSISEIPRLPRSTKQWKYWKASEWRNFLLFFSPIVLKGVLPRRYYVNWMKFVQIMHVLLNETVPLHNIPLIRKELVNFLTEYQTLYGKEKMTFNAHILLHMTDSVKNWGPLWNYSAFSFENMNGKLLKSFQGTRFVGQQICEKYLMSLQLQKFASLAKPDTSFMNVFGSIIRGYKPRRFAQQIGNIIVYGKGESENNKCLFKKVSFGSLTYSVNKVKKSRRKNSYFLNENAFSCIRQIALSCTTLTHPGNCSCEKTVAVRAQKYRVKTNILSVLDKTLQINAIVEVQPTDIVEEIYDFSPKKCLFFEIDETMYMCVIHENLVHEAK
ncbi:uncharacterized protein LOC135370983 [Ornithodoros turicata]|uniref:uncharacterized protein LOC135370983 n=1 Tax=Ornithodoros turicata TaxID=34597 RepID=UPI003139D7E2